MSNFVKSNLVKGILNGDDGGILDETLIHLAQLLGGDPVGGVGLGVLEIQIILSLLVEF